jgi:hypothetical protein
MLRLGLFENFKSEEKMILCSGNSKDMEFLHELLGRVESGTQESIPLHDHASVAPNHPVKLFAVRSLPLKPTAGEFALFCSGEAGLEIRDKIKPLTKVQDGHQYFDLSQDGGTLMISVDEYDDEWWTTHG